MCRIAGIIASDLAPQGIREKVHQMCYELRHGGPDDEGFFTDDHVNLVFGHRRLAILDLTKNGHQPMSDIQQKVWITFNGEIYNYQELKAELRLAGTSFETNTDTEVIIAAYNYWGMGAFAKLRGIFAFALYDVRRAITYLVRDSAGVKPLYYHVENGRLSFASEVKAFKAAGIANDPDRAWQIRFLAYGHLPEPYTTLKNVYSLPKGEFLCWHHYNNTYEIHSYHVVSQTSPSFTNINQAKEAVHAAFKLSLKRQLVADAPIGVFLSGGIDSSLITLLANEQKKTQLKTISIHFNEKAYDESSYQDLVLRDIEGDKFSYLLRKKDLENFMPDIISDMDMPTTDGINTWFISKYAHESGLKAVLSGVGADELFGGYPSFTRIKYLRSLRKTPQVIFSLSNRLVPDRYRKIAYLTYKHPIADYLLLRGLFAPLDIAQILDIGVNKVEDALFNNKQLPYIRNYDELDAAWLETNLYMQNQLLRDTDVMGMCHGLEIRVPFLDEDFKRLVESIPSDIRFSAAQPKKLLIDSFVDILPKATWDRPKMGFTFPLQEWMKENTEINNLDLYKGKKAKSIVKAFKEDTTHWSKAFALYQISTYV